MSLRDSLRRYVPSWLSDQYDDKVSVGYGFLSTCARFVDIACASVLEGGLAAVGRNPTALKYVGDARGIVRGRYDTDASYFAKLTTWIDRWKEAGSQRRLAIEVAEYIGDARVRVVNRHGHWVTVDPDGTITATDAAFDWDSISHPERHDPDEPWWSEQWIIVYPTTWPLRSGTLGDLTGDDGFALGHMVPRESIDILKQLFQRWKAEHTLIRCVIWTTDATAFDPDAVGSLKPDGTWGAWSINVGGSQVRSGRDQTTCRYWEPR